jgi:hypothetical protein
VFIAGALAEQGATFEEDDGGCVVLVPDTGRGSALTPVLGRCRRAWIATRSFPSR